jgi:hypothetical protein
MGCEPILNLAATPDEAVSIICTVVNKLYFYVDIGLVESPFQHTCL